MRIGNGFRGYLYMVQKNDIRIGDYEYGLRYLLIKWYADQNKQLFS
jgi:hypothetical protein